MRLGKAGGLAVVAICLLVVGTAVLQRLSMAPTRHPPPAHLQDREDRSPAENGVVSVHDSGNRRHGRIDAWGAGGGDTPLQRLHPPPPTARPACIDTHSSTTNHGDGLVQAPPSRRWVVCKPPQSGDTGSFRPKLLFIAGIEGSGHHGMVPLLRDLAGVTLIASTEQMLTNLWDPTVPISERIKLRGAILRAIQKRFDACVDGATAPVNQVCSHFILFGRANFFSYPYDSPRSPLRHPDLHELTDIVEDPSLSVIFDLKVLILHREPYKTVQSNLRRGFLDDDRCLKEAIRGKRISFRGPCDALWYLAREAEMQLVYMNAEATAFSAQYFRTVDFGVLVKDPGRFIGPLANFFELSSTMRHDLAEAMFKRFHGSKRHNRLLKPDQEKELARFFGDDRKLRWQLIQSGAFDLRALDGLAGTGETELGYTCLNLSNVTVDDADGEM
mmetsp:Transcript_29714/g.77944  ORF Transcript_29714/g.77944 Transcript_29714/m.77944 type:complete len:444 (+) Transcript_29714:61-1392(+)